MAPTTKPKNQHRSTSSLSHDRTSLPNKITTVPASAGPDSKLDPQTEGMPASQRKAHSVKKKASKSSDVTALQHSYKVPISKTGGDSLNNTKVSLKTQAAVNSYYKSNP